MNERTKHQLSSLKVGEAYVYYSHLETPQLVMTEDIREKEGIKKESVPNDEIARRSTYWQSRQQLLKPFRECDLSRTCDLGCDFKMRSDADHLASRMFQTYGKAINDSETLKRFAVSAQKALASALQDYDGEQYERMVSCIKIRFMRKAQLETSVVLKRQEIAQVIAQKGQKHE
jgi:hypothetical protein